MRVLVVGATGGSGRAAVEGLAARGHEVTAFARRAGAVYAGCAGIRAVDGDATVPEDVDRAVRGQDAVVVTLGISERLAVSGAAVPSAGPGLPAVGSARAS